MEKLKKMKKYQNVLFFIMDVMIVAISYILLELFIREKIYEGLLPFIVNTVALVSILQTMFYMIFDSYKHIIRYESGKDYLVYILVALMSTTTVSLLGMIFKLDVFEATHNFAAALLIAMFTIAYRLVIRMILTQENEDKIENEKKNLLIIGGGSATKDIIKAVKEKMKHTYNIVGIIDDDATKLDYKISNVPIIGNRNQIQEICKNKKVDLIFFSISRIDKKNKKEILEICQETGAKLRILPSTEDLIKDKTVFENLRDVEIEDILGRDPIKLDNNNIEELIKGKVVLVTGGGGSIGSELCRQIVKYKPEKLVMLDIYENTLYDIELELKANYPDIPIIAIIGSVRDKKKLEKLFETYKPYLVFHAAAHKHVPLMEGSPLEAIKNNVIGTYNVVNCADKYKTKRFVLISTDKAVNPTNVMGATKRMCEMIVQAKNKVSDTEYAAVRFGNVLGSNGSVVPLFKKQIKTGGPVTVTHKEITRFFMTIPEAVQLVLQAITYAKGGEIFVLDMGEPVKIYDLAVSLIKLSGLEPNVDIPIKITGLRPGEKLYEELLMSEEGLEKTAHNKIFIAEPLDVTMEQVEEKIETLEELTKNEDNALAQIRKVIRVVVPTFREPAEANKK